MSSATLSAVPPKTTDSGKVRATDLIGAILLAIAVGLLFLKEPGQGDDFTYWSTAWDIHLRGIEGWSAKSFHDLRWPVWGLNWVFQSIVGPGLFSFYAVPFFYLSIGSTIAFVLGSRIFNARAGGWAVTIAFLYNTLLDTVVFRPMPDLGEGTLIGVVVLCWLGIVNSDRTLHRVLLALTAGLVSGLLFSNRITGVFVFGVLAAVALTTCWRNPRFSWQQAALWLGSIFLVWAAFVTAEGIFYHSITGDYLHALHANMGAKGKKGTESVAIFKLPFRFLKNLQGNGALGTIYLLLAVAGGVHLWRRGGQTGRVIAAWAVALYLCYSCSIQSISPVRPLLRDADRFLASLALPLSTLAIAGLWWLLSYTPKLRAIAIQRPVAIGLAALLLLSLTSSRRFFNLGYTGEFREYLETIPAGSTIFTQRWMQMQAFMVNPKKALEFKWKVKDKILTQSASLEKMASASDEFWYCRKVAWLSTRKQLENDDDVEAGTLGTYFADPRQNWELRKVMVIGGLPDLIFYSRRPAGAKLPESVDAHSFFPSLIALPLSWTREETKGKEKTRFDSPIIPIPESLRGKNVRIEFITSANTVQAATLQFHFSNGTKKLPRLEIRPYFFTKPQLEFHALQIPADADSVKLEARTSDKAKWIKLDQVRIIVEEPSTASTAAKEPVVPL